MPEAIELVEYGLKVSCQDCGALLDMSLNEGTFGDDGRQRCDVCDAEYRDQISFRAQCAVIAWDSWHNPNWSEDGWTADSRVGLTPIGHMDIQLDELRQIIER
jgi:hypothetical protein